jgi:heat shock protein 4
LCKQSITGQINAVVQKALDAAGLKADDIDSVEIVGGATRIPIVQAELGAFFGKELSKTCDSDESVARGCALQCAMLSPAFRVREFEVCDTTPYPIEVQWGPAPSPNAMADGEIEQSSPLFTAHNPIPSVKVISFKDRSEPFQLTARYPDDANVANTCDPTIGRFVVSGMKAGDDLPKIKVRVKLDLHGICKVTEAHMLVPDGFEAPKVEPKKVIPTRKLKHKAHTQNTHKMKFTTHAN